LSSNIGFSGSIFSAKKKKTLGGYGWVGGSGGLEFILFLLGRIKEKKF
jgi:hypothetical protein